MSGAILLLPNMLSYHGAQLKKAQGQFYLYLILNYRKLPNNGPHLTVTEKGYNSAIAPQPSQLFPTLTGQLSQILWSLTFVSSMPLMFL
jgi:hypothetical protein